MEEETRPMGVSALAVAELRAGVRDGKEKDQLAELLSIFDQIPADPETAVEGGLFRRDFGPSYGTGLIDAILAATALKHGLRRYPERQALSHAAGSYRPVPQAMTRPS